MADKIGYKTFERLCDVAIVFARTQTWEDEQALVDVQNAYGWPWCLTQTQMDDWNALHRRLDP